MLVVPCVSSSSVNLTAHTMKKLSIIILTFNHLADTRRCLDALMPVMQRDHTEVIVIDNASTDGTPDFIRATYPMVRLTVNTTNRGVAAARNQGFAQATAPTLLILDNDTIANQRAIDGMMDYLESHPKVGLCACRMTDIEGNVQRSFRPFPGLKGKALSVLGLRLATEKFRVDEEGAIEPYYVIGACQMIRRQALEQVGNLDEAIFYGPEDADFCQRLRQAGWQIKYLPQFSIVHTYYRRTRRNPLSRLGLHHIRGLLHFYSKWGRIS